MAKNNAIVEAATNKQALSRGYEKSKDPNNCSFQHTTHVDFVKEHQHWASLLPT